MKMAQRIVKFEYCNSCENFNKKEDDDPCFDCLDQPINEDSRKPINYKEAKGKKDKKNG